MKHTHGEIEYVKGRMQDAIQKGMPEVGWRGDPLLSLVFNHQQETWIVQDHAFSPPKVVLRKPANGMRDLDFRSLCVKLRDGSFEGQTVETIMDRMDARNAEIQKQRDYKALQLHQEGAERLAWAVNRDLG